ncbi:MAG: hypothetical protein Q4E61_03255 [Alphaproteobacteria bacterium]|nr:hypothetical protein [Alphaproteobacteria bacterium]
MKKFCKISSIFPLFIFGTFGMTPENYTLEYYNYAECKTETYNFTDEIVNIDSLIDGSQAQKLDTIEKLYEKHCENLVDYVKDKTLSEETPLEDVLFYIITDTTCQIGDNCYHLKNHEGIELIDRILGIISQEFIQSKLDEIEQALQPYPLASEYIARFKQVLVTNYIPGTEISENDIREYILKDSGYEKIEDYQIAIQNELTPEYKYLELLAIELFGILHNLKK